MHFLHLLPEQPFFPVRLSLYSLPDFVLPSSSVTSTVPQIKEVKKENGSIVVTVEFSSTTQEIAVETYRYILEFDSLSGEPYLSSIQSA